MLYIVNMADKWSEEKPLGTRIEYSLPFLVMERLGSGSFGEVFRVVDERTQLQFALKRIKKRADTEPIQLSEEVVLQHKHITRIIDKFQTQEHNYLLMELARGGSLRQLILARGQAGLPEAEVAALARGLLEGIAYLHRLHIIHRDIKPENILLAEAGHLAGAKLADFGLSVFRYDFHELNKFKGTPAYMAPQIFHKACYNKAIDLWSLGAVLFQLLHKGDKLYQLYQLDRSENRDKFIYRASQELSSSANDFLGLLLRINPKERQEPYQLLGHPFISQNVRDKPVLSYADSIAVFQDMMLIVRALRAALFVQRTVRNKPVYPQVKNFIIRKPVNIVERHLLMLKGIEPLKPKKVVSFKKEEVPAAQRKAENILLEFGMIGPRQLMQTSKSEAEGEPRLHIKEESKETSDSLRQAMSLDKPEGKEETKQESKSEKATSKKQLSRVPRRPSRINLVNGRR